jgi:hypothetical protein
MRSFFISALFSVHSALGEWVTIETQNAPTARTSMAMANTQDGVLFFGGTAGESGTF